MSLYSDLNEVLTPYAQKIKGLSWDLSMIAPVEVTYTATRNYTVGQLLIVDNTLYKVTSNIANGGTITAGTNVVATTLSTDLDDLKGEVLGIDSLIGTGVVDDDT